MFWWYIENVKFYLLVRQLNSLSTPVQNEAFCTCLSTAWQHSFECISYFSAHSQPQIPATKLRGLSPRANYTDRAAAAGRRS
jgi:hypothetical protein